MDRQVICRLKLDGFTISAEGFHESSAALNDARPAQLVEDFVNRVVRDDIEKMAALHEVSQCFPN
jgi:hypothetical protein